MKKKSVSALHVIPCSLHGGDDSGKRGSGLGEGSMKCFVITIFTLFMYCRVLAGTIVRREVRIKEEQKRYYTGRY